MIHVLNFKDEIIDFISQNDEHIIQANHKRNINDRSETFDFTILSKRTEHLKERNRIIIQDSNKQYREFIIEHISSDIDGYTTIESSASYLQDIATAKPLAPMKLEKMTTMQALKEVLKDTGWEASDETEYGGTRTTSWTSYNTKYEVLLQLCTTYSMMLDFYIELDSNTVKHRYVTLKKRNALFKGKEITYGKDLLGLKRTVDLSSIKTALLCVGPEDDKGQRIVLEVHDDEAQERFGLPKRYIWDVYEPESSDDKMTEARLRTLGTTELNKRKVEIISYEVSSLDIKDSQPHEVVYLGDKVRIKNRDFTPPLYVEAEVIGEEYDLIAKESNYLFGQYKEYREEDLRKAFEKRLSDIRTKLNDSISNVNTIMQETLDNELQHFEKKIIKSDTPPENAVNDVLWLDTSNPNVPILKRYWEGQWIKASVDNVEQIGGITREKALFSELNNTFINLTIQHSKLLNEMHEVMNNEYLVDEDIKFSLNGNLDKTISVFNSIKTNLDSMTEDTATIGKLVDTQTLFLKYREQLQALYKVVEQAKLSIDARFKLLQSQYTDEKFNEALSEVAEKFGLQVSENNELIGEPNVIQKAISVVTEQTDNKLANYVKSQDYQTDKNGIVERLNNSDSERQQLSNQIADRVTLTEYRNMKVGTRNLLTNTNYINPVNHWYAITQIIEGNPKSLFVKSNGNRVTYGFITDKTTNIESGKQYTLKLDLKTNSITSLNYMYYVPISGASYKENTMNIDNITPDGTWRTYSVTFTATTSMSNVGVLIGTNHGDGFELRKAMLVEGNRAGDYQEAPEDTDQKLTTMKTEVIQDGRKYSQEVSQQIYNASSKTLNQIVSKYINDTSTGHQFTYDENGNISSFVVGSGGIKINGDKVNITANKEFAAMVNTVSNKADETNIINKINLSREGLDINVNNIGIRGGDSTNYLTIKNQEILSRGIFTRTWGGVTDTPTATVGIKDGYILSRNEKTGYNLYMTEKGLSTMMSGGVGSEQAGALEFHYDLMNDNSRGVRLSSTYGVVFLHSEHSRIYTRSRYTTNIESWESSIYLRPQVNSRTGVNEFSFYIKDNDSAGDTDGTLLFGEISDEKGLAGSGIRFKKGAIRGKTESIVYATDNQGNIGTGSFYGNRLYGDWTTKTGNLYACVDDKLRITDTNGYNGGDTNYKNLQCKDIQANTIRVNTGSNFYLGVSTGELRVTNNLMYNGGDIGYKAVRASAFTPGSYYQYKEDITKWDYDALSVIKSEFQAYQYKLINDENGKLRRGVIVGGGYETITEFIDKDGVDLYEMTTWALRGVQQLAQENDERKNENEVSKNIISDLENRLQLLEDKLNEQKS